MKIKLWHIVALFFFILVAQIIGERAGLLDPSREIIWYDNIMHALAGVLTGIFVLWGIQKEKRNIKGWRLAAAIIGITIIIAILWELFELAAFQIIRDFALSNNLYSTSISEAILDTLSNAVGGAVVAYFALKK
jgi:hypothetical protein